MYIVYNVIAQARIIIVLSSFLIFDRLTGAEFLLRYLIYRR